MPFFGMLRNKKIYIKIKKRGINPPLYSTPARNRTWTLSSGGSRYIHLTTGAKRGANKTN